MAKAQLQNSLFYILLILIIIQSCTSKNTDNNFYNNTLGLNVNVQKQEYSFREESTQNEGFSFDIVSFFLKGKDILNGSNYPKNYEFREDWNISKWKQTPFFDKEGVLDLLFKYDIKNEELKSHIENFKKLIENEGNYFSYYYESEGNYVYSIEFYLIDVKNNQIFIIEIET